MVNTMNSEKSSVAAPAPASRNSGSSSYTKIFMPKDFFGITYRFIRNLNITFFDLSAFLRGLKQP
jgi:hypothetical protein